MLLVPRIRVWPGALSTCLWSHAVYAFCRLLALQAHHAPRAQGRVPRVSACRVCLHQGLLSLVCCGSAPLCFHISVSLCLSSVASLSVALCFVCCCDSFPRRLYLCVSVPRDSVASVATLWPHAVLFLRESSCRYLADARVPVSRPFTHCRAPSIPSHAHTPHSPPPPLD